MTRQRLFGIRAPFTIVVLFTVLALFIGLGIRTTLASPQLKERIEQSISGNILQGKVQVGKIDLSLANGLLPDFSLRIGLIGLRLSEGCYADSEITLNAVRIPYRILSFLMGPPQWGSISIEQVNVDLSNGAYHCLENAKYARNASGAHSQSGIILVSQKKPSFDLKILSQASESLQGLYVRKISVHNRGRSLIDLNKLRFSLRPGRYRMSLTANLDSTIAFGEKIPAVKIQATATDDTIDFQVDGRWREGIVGLEVFNRFSTGQMDLEFAFKNIPIAPLSKLMSSMGLLNQEFHSHSMWVSCAISASGNMGKIGEAPWLVKKCNLTGESAELAFGDVSYVPKTGRYQPFVISVESLDFMKVISATGGVHPSSSLGNLGTINGDIEILSPTEIKFLGKWKDLELIFSNRGFRQTQKVNSFELSLHKMDNRVAFNIQNIQLKDGAMVGSIEADLDAKLESGRISFDLAQLKLTKSVEQLMLSGVTEPMQLEGFIDVIDKDIVAAEMKLNVPKVNGDEMEIEGAKFDVTNKNREWNIKSEILRLKFSEKTRAHRIFQELFADTVGLRPEITKIKGTVIASDQQLLKWESIQAEFEQIDGEIKTSGGWDAEGKLAGSIETRVKKVKSRFELSGTRDEPLFTRALKVKKSRNGSGRRKLKANKKIRKSKSLENGKSKNR